MAIYSLSARKPIMRSAGRSTTAAAAYAAAEKIKDSRTGEIHDYSRKRGVVAGEVLLPGGATMDRAAAWNMIENGHPRGDATLGYELICALPHELSADERAAVSKKFAQSLADKYGVLVDYNVHQPDPQGDPRNFHTHILISGCYVTPGGELTGRVTKKGPTAKKCVELDPIHCDRAKIENMIETQRVRWQNMNNDSMADAGHSERIDHRSNQARGIDRAPSVHLGPAATASQRRGETSQITQRERAKVARLVADAQAAIDTHADRELHAEIDAKQAKLARLQELAALPPDAKRSTLIRAEIDYQDARQALLVRDEAARSALPRAVVDKARKELPEARQRLTVAKSQHSAIVKSITDSPFFTNTKKAKAEARRLAEVIESIQALITLLFGRSKAPIKEDLPAIEERLRAQQAAAKVAIDVLAPDVAAAERAKRANAGKSEAIQQAAKAAKEAQEAAAKAQLYKDAIDRAKARESGSQAATPDEPKPTRRKIPKIR